MFRNYKFDPNDPSGKYSFDINNVDVSIVNGIRRTILTDIPIPGIVGEKNTTVEIITNTGSLHNEIIAHRIGLLPICLTEQETENYQDNSIEIELNVTNNDIALANVNTGNITGTFNGKKLTPQQLAIMFPKNPVTNSHILITRLKATEQLHFKAKVVKKTARYNSAFSPVSLSNFYYIQDDSLVTKDMNVLERERAYIANKYGEAISIKFEIEPINQNLGAKYLFSKAIDIIIEKLVVLSRNLNSDNETVTVSQYEDLPNTYQFVINEEDDTIGNILQSIIHNKYIRQNMKMDNMSCSYIGYLCPHPLKTELLIRITLVDQDNVNRFVEFLDKNCKAIIDDLIAIKNEWQSFAK